MKKLFGILVSLCASMICLTSVSAKQVNLTDPEFNNSYIIGRRVFTLGSYALTAWDVKEATDEFHQNVKGTDKTPMYYIVDGRIWSVGGDGVNWNDELNLSDFNNVFGVNNDPIVHPEIPYDEEKVNAKIDNVVNNLNAGSSEYGIEGIEYSDEDNTLTFNVSDGEKPISDYAKSGIVDFLKAFVSDEFGAQSVSINGHDYGDVTDLNETDIVGLAAAAIKDIIGEETEEILSSLEGKEITVSVTYGDGQTIDYHVSFVENN